MEALSVRDYRNNLAASFDRANKGETVIIRRRGQLYALTSLGKEDVSISRNFQNRLDSLTDRICEGLKEVKKIESGKQPFKSARAFLDEL